MDFIDLHEQQRRISDQLHSRIKKVLSHGQYIHGPEVQELEQKLTQFVGAKHGIGVANGTDALQIAMMALEVGPGDEVITTPFSFVATTETIALLGATPVYVDIDPKTYNIDPTLIEAAITKKTKVILPVSLYGQCADMDRINEIAKRHQLSVIEDAAQSFGAEYKGRKSCGLSTIACTSFFPSKPLGAYGDAGACFTSDDELAKRMKEIRVHGSSRRYFHTRLGVNSRLDTLQAAILLAKFDVFASEIEARQEKAKYYSDKLRDLVQTPFVEKDNISAYAQYTIASSNRAHLEEVLKAKGIPTAVHYPTPLHKQPAFEAISRTVGEMKHSEWAANSVLSLPLHPYLTNEQQDQVIAAVKSAVN